MRSAVEIDITSSALCCNKFAWMEWHFWILYGIEIQMALCCNFTLKFHICLVKTHIIELLWQFRIKQHINWLRLEHAAKFLSPALQYAINFHTFGWNKFSLSVFSRSADSSISLNLYTLDCRDVYSISSKNKIEKQKTCAIVQCAMCMHSRSNVFFNFFSSNLSASKSIVKIKSVAMVQFSDFMEMWISNLFSSACAAGTH